MTTAEALKRIILEAAELAKNCPPTNHACSACEILYVARLALNDLGCSRRGPDAEQFYDSFD